MLIVSMLPHAEIGRNDHREGAPHFNIDIISLFTDKLVKDHKTSPKLHYIKTHVTVNKIIYIQNAFFFANSLKSKF